MRRPISQQMSFGDGFIDASLYKLDEELTKVDELLSNAQLLKPFEEAFDPSLGRPGHGGRDLSPDDVPEISLGIELRRSGAGSKRETALAVFLSSFFDGSSPGRDHLDQAQSKIWRRSGHSPQPAVGQAIVEEPFDQAAKDSDRLHHP